MSNDWRQSSSRPMHWPDGQSSNTPSSAASFGFDIAAELSRMNHPTARFNEAPYTRPVRADLLARVLPFADESEVGIPADRRRHGDRSRPATAVVGAASSTPAGARRGLIALACCFVVGFVVGRRL